MGILFDRLGEYKLALEMYNIQLKMVVEKIFGSDHIEMYLPLVSIANFLRDQGKYEEALNNYTATSVIAENEWGSDDKRVAFILSNMGDVYRMLDEYDKAIDVLNRALAI